MHDGAEAGTLDDEGVAPVFLDLASRRITGVLEVYGAGKVRRVAFRKGAPFWISSDVRGPAWRLGDILRRLDVGSLNRDAATLRRAVVFASGRVGEALVTNGFASSEDVARALDEQLRLRAADLINLTKGRWRLWTGTRALEHVPRLPAHWTAEELIAGARRSAPDEIPRSSSTLAHEVHRLERENSAKAVLGVAANAKDEEIRAAWRRLARLHHPDQLDPGLDEASRRLHHRAFVAVARAAEQALNEG